MEERYALRVVVMRPWMVGQGRLHLSVWRHAWEIELCKRREVA